MTEERHHRSSESGQYIHGDSIFTLKLLVRSITRDIEAMEGHIKELQQIKEHTNDSIERLKKFLKNST